MIKWESKPPYSHKWHKIHVSIMNPIAKITFPQYIMEMAVYNRTKFLKTFPKIQKGPKWSQQIAKQVRQLCQQASVICNYFPHPDDEPLVVVSFRNFFRTNRTTKIGAFRKARINKTGKSNITIDEKDVVTGITKELKRLQKQRDMFKTVLKDKDLDEIKFKTNHGTIRKDNKQSILELEKELFNGKNR